jgi:cell wall-associated NlpC family hydrolase
MRSRGLPAILAIALLSAGCAGTPVQGTAEHGAAAAQSAPVTTAVPATADVRASIADLAVTMVGVRYRYGGAHPSDGFDCSGLVYYAFASNGHVVPRTSRQQFDAAQKIPLERAAKSDLLFFRDQEQLSHVAIYLGDGRFVHSPSSGGAVRIEFIDTPYYQRNLVAVGRLLPPQ